MLSFMTILWLINIHPPAPRILSNSFGTTLLFLSSCLDNAGK